MSKFFSKTVKKTALFSVILAIILAAAVVIGAVFQMNKAVALDDYKTLTVTVDSYTYTTKKDSVVADSESKFGGNKAEYVVYGEMNADCEITFVFDSKADLSEVKTNLAAYFEPLTKEGGKYAGSIIAVSTGSENVSAVLAKHFVLRSVIAGVIFAVLAFAYVAIRFRKVSEGLVVCVSVLLGMLLTTALIVLTRVYVTISAAWVIAISGLLTAAFVLLTLGKIHTAQKESEETSDEEIVASSVACREILYASLVLLVGLGLVACFGKSTGLWFALVAALGVLSAALISLFFAPAMYLSVKTVVNKIPVKGSYVGAKEKAVAPKRGKKVKEAPVEEKPVEVAPVEEKPVEAAPVEETPVEAAPVEEKPAEVAPVEETPVEDVPVEETPVEVAAEEEVSVEKESEA